MSRGLGEMAKLAATRAKKRVQNAQATPSPINAETQNLLNAKNLKKKTMERGSYYISLDVLTQLDLAQIKVRRFLPQTPRGDLSKSKLVEVAMQIVFKDLETHGEQAELVRRLRPR